MQFVDSIEMDSISFAFDEKTKLPIVGAGVKATFTNPYGFKIQIQDIGMDVAILNASHVPYMDLSVPLGPTEPCVGSVACVDFSAAELKVNPDAEASFKETVLNVLTQKSVPVIVSANSTVGAMTNMGQIEITGFPFETTIDIQGMNGFKNANITMKDIVSSKGVGDQLTLRVSVYIDNPSNISAKMGMFNFDIYYKRVKMGFGEMGQFSVKPGVNLLVLDVTLVQTEADYALISEFIFLYIKADSVLPVVMHGKENSTNIPLLAPILDNLELGFDFKPTPTDFIVSIFVEAKLQVGLPQITAYCTIYNPMAGPIHLDYLDIDVFFKNPDDGLLHRLYTLKQSFNGVQPRLEPDTSTKIILDIGLKGLNPNWDVLEELYDVLKGEIVVSVKGPVVITILPSFAQNMTYAGDNITANVTICGMMPFPNCPSQTPVSLPLESGYMLTDM